MTFGRNFPAARALTAMRQRPQELSNAALKARADKMFKIKEAQRIDAPIAMAEYRAAENALRSRTAQLRAERLAREAGKGPLKPESKSRGKAGATVRPATAADR